MRCITSITPTMCGLLGIPVPTTCQDQPLEPVMELARRTFDGRPAERVLAYLPDCVGTAMVGRVPEAFEIVRRHTPLEAPLRAVYPPKTPVCFASMWTGAQPAVHGIRKYERPVLTCDTIFDALIRAGRKPAIVAVQNCSMDLIFRERPMDYYSEADDEATMSRTMELLKADKYDFLICYQIGYDKLGHRTGPYSPESIEQVHVKARNLERVAAKAHECWRGRRRVLSWNPDHGSHMDVTSGKADHCYDIPQDMDVHHFFGMYAD